jgi:hypothetical protein
VKKRWLVLVAAILLAVSPVLAAGACAESVLVNKMQKQLDAGSGLKGTVTVSGIAGLDGLSLDAQYILQKVQSQLTLSLKNSGGELAKLSLYGQDGALALDAFLTSGKLYSIKDGWESLMNRILVGETGGWQTSVNSALLSILSPENEKDAAKLNEAAAPYLTKIDLWMQGFAEPSALEKDPNGVSFMKGVYHIPAAAFKAELKQLMVDLLADKTLLPLLWAKMTQEQANLYLNPALQSFYFTAVDALPLQGEITMLRRVTTTGQLLETSLSLPLNGTAGGMKQMSFTSKAVSEGDLLDCTFISEEGSLQFTALKPASSQPDTFAYSGIIRYLPAQMPNWQVDATTPQYTGKALSVSYQAAYVTKLSTDADGKSVESYTLTVSLVPDWSHLTQEVTEEIKSLYVLTDPVQLTGTVLFTSGQARNASTSLTAELHYVSGATDWKINGLFKTTPPWNFNQVDMNAAEKLESMSSEQLSVLLTEFLSKPGLLPLIINITPLIKDNPDTVG